LSLVVDTYKKKSRLKHFGSYGQNGENDGCRSNGGDDGRNGCDICDNETE